MQEESRFLSSIHVYRRDNTLLPTQLPSQAVQQHPWRTDVNHLGPPQSVLSHGLFRVLQSNGDAACLNVHYTDLCDPPDLYAALREEQIPPPCEDMNPEDPGMIPCRGNKREGWRGICKPGRWLVLKNSAFCPQQKRLMDGKPDVWEGLWGVCGQWIALISSKKKVTTWFRHAYKCHTHLKVKDTSKRRRKRGNAKGFGQASRRKLNINGPWQ
ncbi:hypothetical protein FPOA_13141 [Fusarium poae]|uniref:Uncharacterized protein n=2 Tax=Fusarium poae TaxID=36050 RepID=A0A1B8A6Q3_FUSPO|nr:hypothetical protein FPOA_13413 [Fusarium poae]OBS16150.1 hypothetical protein FPOA_13141 [Fusarium poae]